MTVTRMVRPNNIRYFLHIDLIEKCEDSLVFLDLGCTTSLETLYFTFPPILDPHRAAELSSQLTSFIRASLTSVTSPFVKGIKFVIHALTPNNLKCIDWADIDKILFDNPNFRQVKNVVIEMYPLPHACGTAARDTFREKHGAESERIIYSGLEQTARVVGRLLVRYSAHSAPYTEAELRAIANMRTHHSPPFS